MDLTILESLDIIHILNNGSKNKMLLNDEVVDSLKRRGYAFVKLDENFSKIVDKCLVEMKEFFNIETNEKEKFFREPVFGYFTVEHKEVFRFLTGNKLKLQKFPESFNNMMELTKYLDDLMPKVTNTLFPNISNHIEDIIPFNQWGMIDVVQYFNNSNRDINVVEHYDAGLLAFSFCSTEPGLELKNEHGEWVKPPDNTAILWTGSAIKKYDINHPVGIHRVVKSDNPRIAIWYEICTYEQERNDMLSNYKGYQYEIDLMKKEGYEPIRDNGSIVGYQKDGEKKIGFKALESVTTGSNKIALGYNNSIIGNNSNVAIGSLAVLNNNIPKEKPKKFEKCKKDNWKYKNLAKKY